MTSGLETDVDNAFETSPSSEFYLHFRDEGLVDNGSGLHVAVVRGRYLVDHFTVLLRENDVLVWQVRLQPVPRGLTFNDVFNTKLGSLDSVLSKASD